MKRVLSLLALSVVAPTSFSDMDLTQLCFSPWDALQQTQPEFVKDALEESNNYNFIEFSSAAGIAPGWANEEKAKIGGSVETKYYDIEGSNPQELVDQLAKNIPFAARLIAGNPDTTNRVDAVTGTNYTWRYWLDPVSPNENTCTLRWVTVDVHITYWMPRWVNPEAGTPELRTDWFEYSKALAYHEQGHGAHAYKSGQNALDQMLALKGEVKDCETFGTELDKIGKAAQDQIRENDLEYDRLTYSGATQGARFGRREMCRSHHHTTAKDWK